MAENVTEFNLTLVAEITRELAAQELSVTSTVANDIWMLAAGFLVFFMHAGFAMLEGGSVRATSVTNIMFKNITTISIGAVFYWFFGFAFAYGSDNVDGGAFPFIGSGDFAGRFDPSLDALWFFQMVFAATAATIVSGAVAGRIKLVSYFVVAVFLTAFVYPVVSHWIWATGGWLSAFTPSEDLFMSGTPCGVIDFAGSGVVHMTGGVAAFWGAKIVGPREGFKEGIPPHNYALMTLGTLILWFGWFGFNCGSTLAWDGTIAGHVAITTVLSPSAAFLVGAFLSRYTEKKWNLGTGLNCVLGGLVGITAGCSVIPPGLAVVTGIIAGFVYIGGSKLVKKLGVDDPVDATAVHGICGLWGLIATALFADEGQLANAYSRECDAGVGDLLGWQLLGAVSIFGWVTALMVPTFLILKSRGLLTLEAEHHANVDMTEHGAKAYEKI